MTRALFAILACTGMAHAAQIVGTWKLLSYVREEIPSGRKTDVMGPHPSGYLIYGADGRMMVIFVRTDRQKQAGAIPTAHESEDLLQGMVSYTGTYEVHADKIIHHVDVSWNQAWTGTDQTRSYELEGDRLSLSTTPSLDPIEGKMSVRTLIWERVPPRAEPFKNALVGTWEVTSSSMEEIPSGKTRKLYGAHPAGYLIYGADGRMMAIVTSTERRKPAGSVPTTQEAEELYKSFFSYTGTYLFEGDGKAVHHHVDVSWNQAWTGTDQTRSYKLEGDRLSLSTTPSLDPIGGKMSIRTFTWEQVK